MSSSLSAPDEASALPPAPPRSRPFYRHIYFWVLLGVVAGVAFGLTFPSAAGAPGWAEKMKPLADGFISLIKMLIAPIIFLTVVGGIAGAGDLKKVGRVGLKALIYFEVVTTLAMIVALGAVHLFRPGAGVNYVPSASEVKKLETYSEAAKEQSSVEFVLHIIPKSFVGAFTEGEITQVLLISILMGIALARMGDAATSLTRALNLASQAFFRIVEMVVWLAPIAAFGAMASTVGSAGVQA